MVVSHLIRDTFRFASKADWGQMARHLRSVYTAISEADAKERFGAFAEIWGEKCPAVVWLRENAWAEFVPFLDHSPEIRKVVYTTDVIVNPLLLVSLVASARPSPRRLVPAVRRSPSGHRVAG